MGRGYFAGKTQELQYLVRHEVMLKAWWRHARRPAAKDNEASTQFCHAPESCG